MFTGKLAEGIPAQRVLSDIRSSATSNHLGRIHLIEKKDLNNIKRDFCIDRTYKLHDNDAISVRLLVQSLREKGNKETILFYKEVGESCSKGILETNDFVLIIMTEFQESQLLEFGSQKICIDGTHGLNSYSFQLYTIMVVNSYGSGIPVAFCFSNRADTKLFRLYFDCIKSRTGLIKPDVFMSDDEPAFYNAWCTVMGDVPNQLLCTWHVQRNWFQNLKKIKTKQKRLVVFKTLKVLQTEISEDLFKKGLKTFLGDLKGDSDTSAFYVYFSKTYCSRVQKWAYCFRQYLGINTNMYLESLHKTLKHHYLDGKKCKRLDKTINALLVLLRDKMFETLIKHTKNKMSSKTLCIRTSHML